MTLTSEQVTKIVATYIRQTKIRFEFWSIRNIEAIGDRDCRVHLSFWDSPETTRRLLKEIAPEKEANFRPLLEGEQRVVFQIRNGVVVDEDWEKIEFD